ncbi:hypothetical protein ACFSTH_07985 [Paenibacillus yanchengensis]|uniref:Uncharacterized protein n=1 Tax=Paenibacillus yanchengensis TaxID=2035833 RepID=A0ABW4YLP9_9BACL
MEYMKTKQLVEQLCNAILNHQVTGFLPEWEGGIACPSCKNIHGRSGDAIFPLYYTAIETGQVQYKEAARKLVAYMQRRQLYDGSWLNDEPSDWKGTTVFQVLSLSHAYDYLSRAGEQQEAENLLPLIQKAAGWLVWAFCQGGIPKNNINYLVSAAAALQWCAKILDDSCYATDAEELMRQSLVQVNRDGFLVGESKYPHLAGDQIDIGYNIDMSIGVMAEYAMLTNDEAVREQAVRALQAHMEMMYPDGSIDNSFGSRSYKWTMYGSKTAHGCQMAYMILADENPAFIEAASRNLTFLTSCITSNGMVGYGPAHEQLKLDTCIHSTLNRADSLAVALVYGKWDVKTANKATIPADINFGFKYYRSLNTAQIRSQSWMGTISGYGSLNAATGGMLSYLWQEQYGAVQASSATVYKRTEIANMPEYPGRYVGPLTPRIEAIIAGNRVSSLYEHQPAILQDEKTNTLGKVRVEGKLKSVPLETQVESQLFYTIDYEWSDKQIKKVYYIDVQVACEELYITEPIIVTDDVEVKGLTTGLQLTKQSIKLHIEGSGEHFEKQPTTAEKVISLFPALESVPLRWKLSHVERGVYTFTFTLTDGVIEQREEGETDENS